MSRLPMCRRFLRVATIAVLPLGFAPFTAQSTEFINILTGGQSGVYYPLGVAVEKLVAENVADTKPSVQSTKASVENLNLLQDGKGELAFALGDSVLLAWQGDSEAGFKAPLDKLRAVGAIYPNFVQVVASKESGIRTLADLKGKRLSVGAPRSGTELNARAILGAAGISYSDLSKVEYLPFAESVDLMKNRQLDATLQSAGLGVASIRDLSTSVEIVVVEVPQEVVTKIGSPYVSAVIPANTYTGQDTEVVTAAVVNFLITRSDLADELVYQMTKAIFDNLDAMVAAHAAARQMSVEAAPKDSPVPLHPGAERYFKEKGAL